MNKYIDYCYEDVFTQSITDKNIKQLLQASKIKSVYTTKTIKAGDQFEVEIYPSFTRKQLKELKIKKKNNKAQKNLNNRNSRKRIERLINANFNDDDLFITYTYDNKHLPKTLEEALKNIKNFIRRVNYKRKKEGLPKAKYIYITEFSEDKKIRVHHHLLIDGALSMDILESMWKFGRRNNARRLAKDEFGLTGLAKYLSKDPKGNKRWCSSINLSKPIEHKSYLAFSSRQVNKMVEDHSKIQTILEKKYKNKTLLSYDIRFNEFNGYFYIYSRMRKNR